MDVVRTPATGWIEVVVGSMFSGKSEELIRRLRRAQIARQRVQIFKPSVDTRYATDHIVSHSELRIPSDTAKTAREPWCTPASSAGGTYGQLCNMIGVLRQAAAARADFPVRSTPASRWRPAPGAGSDCGSAGSALTRRVK